MSYKISIILPIFNVEKYLKNALDSIINQTFGIDNLEVIMVNDCSTDNSKEILDDYANKYENFKAIHLKENSGSPGKPRNMGIENATSEYILFLDPDDEFMSDICEVLYEKSVSTGADVVTSNSIVIFPDKECLDMIYPENYYDVILDKNLDNFKPFRSIGTLYKKASLDENNIRFIETATNEDTYFIYECFFKLNRIIYLNDFIGVKIYERPLDERKSVSHTYDKYHIIGTIEAFKQILILISNSNPVKDYRYDPFLLFIYSRFPVIWDMSSKDKKKVFLKIIEYENVSKYEKKLPFYYRFMDFFLRNKLFNCLIIIQFVFSHIVQSNFIRKHILPKLNLKRNVVE